MDWTINKLSTYCFEGYVDLSELSQDQLNALKIEIPRKNEFVELLGDFKIEWDDDIAMVIITGISLFNGKHFIDLTENDIDYDKLSEYIEQYGDYSTWSEDFHSSRVDAAYDRWKDSQYD